MKKEIIWEPWLDPFQPNDDEIGYKNEDKTPYEELEEEEFSRKDPCKPVTIISSPIVGIIPVMPHAVPSKTFNFWIGHTNFDIKKNERNILKHAYGVETLDIISRYRFRIAIGRGFETKDVKNNIKNLLCNEISNIGLDDEITKNINKLQDKLSSENKYWFIFVTPNGVINYDTSNELNSEFENKFTTYKETSDLVNGLLIASWK